MQVSQPQVGREGEEAWWVNRRLARGEPSGEEATEGEELEDNTIKAVKISVTLPSKAKWGERKEEPGKWEERMEVYRERKLQVSSVCREYGLGGFQEGEAGGSGEYRDMLRRFPWPPEKSLMYEAKWHLLYCWIHKVASTSWSRVFLQLAGQQVPLSRSHEATQRFSPTSSVLPIAISTSLVFTIVRHPFERLVSAYRDKFQLARKSAYVYSHYSPKMGGQGRPSFRQFVDYLLEEPVEQYNDHWVPYWLHCHLCQMEYDVIGKMETLEEDMAFIGEKSGLATTNISLPWANRRRSGEQDSLHYWEQLDLDRTRRLYSIYRLDFLMFNYSPLPYFQLWGQGAP